MPQSLYRGYDELYHMSAKSDYLKRKNGVDFKTVVLKADGKFHELEPEAEVEVIHPDDEKDVN